MACELRTSLCPTSANPRELRYLKRCREFPLCPSASEKGTTVFARELEKPAEQANERLPTSRAGARRHLRRRHGDEHPVPQPQCGRLLGQRGLQRVAGA